MILSNDNPNPDFSDAGGSSTSSGASGTSGANDFSDVTGSSSTTASTGGTTYVVKSGDSLSKIAKHFYGDASKWKKIHAANSEKIPNPDLIHPGLQLTIPAA
jgi:nucleoid-associated protein YgaU